MSGNQNIFNMVDPAQKLQDDLTALAPAVAKLVAYYHTQGGAPDIAINAAPGNLTDAQQQATTLLPTYRAWQDMQTLLPLLPNFSFDPSGGQPAPFQMALGVFAVALPAGWNWQKSLSADASIVDKFPVAHLSNYEVFKALKTGKATINATVVDSSNNSSNVTLQVTIYDLRLSQPWAAMASRMVQTIHGESAPTTAEQRTLNVGDFYQFVLPQGTNWVGQGIVSSDPSTVLVEGAVPGRAVVQALKTGMAKVTLTAGGISSTVTFTVVDLAQQTGGVQTTQTCPPCEAIVGVTPPAPTTAPAGYVSTMAAFGAGVGGLLLGALGGYLLAARKTAVPAAHESYSRR